MMTIQIFWDVMPLWLENSYRHYKGL